jgi:hypothetical protein
VTEDAGIKPRTVATKRRVSEGGKRKIQVKETRRRESKGGTRRWVNKGERGGG